MSDENGAVSLALGAETGPSPGGVGSKRTQALVEKHLAIPTCDSEGDEHIGALRAQLKRRRMERETLTLKVALAREEEAIQGQCNALRGDTAPGAPVRTHIEAQTAHRSQCGRC